MNTTMLLELPTCVFIATGGTIAMKHDPARGGPVPALSGDDLLAAVPGLAAIARIEAVNLSNVPSDYMDGPRWVALRRTVSAALERVDVAGVVISHGTDTLEETAWFLELTLATVKPVVLVGAQRNASEADFDGPRNLLAALRVAACGDAVNRGVMVVMNGRVHAARDVTKAHTVDVDAFDSGEHGALGVVDDDRVIFSRRPTRRHTLSLGHGALPRVDIVAMHGGADGAFVRTSAGLGARGIVIEALGCGNVNDEMYVAIGQAIRAGVRVAVSTRVAHGRVRPLYGFTGGGMTLKKAGACFADDLSPQKARILLMLALQLPRPPADLQRLFDR